MSFDQQAVFARLPELEQHARVDLRLVETPIDRLDRLGERLGIELYAKRDETQPFAFGGNKVRQLEYYLGPAQQQGTDTVLITGAIQSNFVRSCAAAARRLGWHAIVQLEERVPKESPEYNQSGNVLLNQLLGAEISYLSVGDDETAADAALDQLAENCREQGRRPFVIHLGVDHPPIGALGYVVAAVECYNQCEQSGHWPDHIVIPSGSGITHSGFLAGMRAIGWDIPVHGICVRRNADLQHSRISKRVAEVNQLINGVATLSADDVSVTDSVLAPGYGLMNDAVSDAIKFAALDEAVLLDPVYSGRAMAGLIDLVNQGIIKPQEKTLFIHTGGLPALFAYREDLATLFD